MKNCMFPLGVALPAGGVPWAEWFAGWRIGAGFRKIGRRFLRMTVVSTLGQSTVARVDCGRIGGV